MARGGVGSASRDHVCHSCTGRYRLNAVGVHHQRVCLGNFAAVRLDSGNFSALCKADLAARRTVGLHSVASEGTRATSARTLASSFRTWRRSSARPASSSTTRSPAGCTALARCKASAAHTTRWSHTKSRPERRWRTCPCSAACNGQECAGAAQHGQECAGAAQHGQECAGAAQHAVDRPRKRACVLRGLPHNATATVPTTARASRRRSAAMRTSRHCAPQYRQRHCDAERSCHCRGRAWARLT
jgi:hypothetical protein